MRRSIFVAAVLICAFSGCIEVFFVEVGCAMGADGDTIG